MKSIIFQIKSYLNFLLNSSNQHGVHSPFVYDFITKCLYTKTDKNKIILSKQYKNQLYNNNTIINVIDFGKGSRIMNASKRKVSQIAKIAGMSNKKSKLIIRIVEYLKPKNILEIGTSLGIGTFNIYLGNKNSKITTLEGCENLANIAKHTLTNNNIQNIDIQIGNFKKTLPKNSNSTFDFIYFDGNHQKEATLDYFNQCLKTIHNDSFFIFDDIHWSKEMKQAWKKIIKHPKVTVSIDTYFWGIVFFRKEQAKEHFTIRV